MLELPVTSFGFHKYPAIRSNHMDDIYGLSGTITGYKSDGLFFRIFLFTGNRQHPLQ